LHAAQRQHQYESAAGDRRGSPLSLNICFAGLPILRQVSALLGHDFIAATRLLAALEAFSHRLPPLERTQFSRLMYSTVHAIGHPAGEQWTYTQGIISQVRTDYRWKGVNDLQHFATVIQTQTPINPGNSGGPLLDDNVSVIGVNAFVMQEKQGLNFAISLGEITQFLARPGNREGTTQVSNPPPPRESLCKEQRQFPYFIDAVSKKKVLPITSELIRRSEMTPYFSTYQASRKAKLPDSILGTFIVIVRADLRTNFFHLFDRFLKERVRPFA
jgi:hypothetical protein